MSCAQLASPDTGPQYRVCSIRWFAMVARSLESAILSKIAGGGPVQD